MSKNNRVDSLKFHNQIQTFFQHQQHRGRISYQSIDQIENQYFDLKIWYTELFYVAQLVEYYDFHKDPIKNYFLDKIQFVLSRSDKIKSMVQQKISQEEEEQLCYIKLQTPKYLTVSRTSSITELIDRENVLIGLELNENHQKSRGQQMNLTLQIQMHKKEQEPSLDKLMSDYKSETERMDHYRKSEMKIQDEAVKFKLEQRRKKLINQQNRIFRTEASDDESTPQLHHLIEIYLQISYKYNCSYVYSNYFVKKTKIVSWTSDKLFCKNVF
ncbi:unnamed protein product (macronuclear) [Paramecium tetraurelia]|uniref:Uncharacterized protein n=1 Tax=Paramecium tetraurelia TaxID=5888 RepID=A0D3Y2_PARTE|nr:uncharacterized protein GSPATT00013214001 [Paramecium tetraurelia]CAK77749.1 unnamed protein product [Paramecium tetraurelia]|eukprot:XP_001445146.1 hypothetical protein (macronuclear) [Paramecium tetraurelia strain d4-2]